MGSLLMFGMQSTKMTKIAFLFLILIIKHSQGDDYDGDGLGEIKATIDEVQKDVKGFGKFLEELTQLFKKHFPVSDDAESCIGSKESSITTSDPELLLCTCRPRLRARPAQALDTPRCASSSWRYTP